METRERRRNGNADRSRDGIESSGGEGNGDESGNGDVNEDGIGEGGGEAKKHKKPHNSCRCNVLPFRTYHHLCRQGVGLAGTQ